MQVSTGISAGLLTQQAFARERALEHPELICHWPAWHVYVAVRILVGSLSLYWDPAGPVALFLERSMIQK